VQAVERTYILTQGPLPSTVSHFWTMVWEQNCKIIAMLNNIIEKNQVMNEITSTECEVL
jgi:protein tyrosine phosphatase